MIVEKRMIADRPERYDKDVVSVKTSIRDVIDIDREGLVCRNMCVAGKLVAHSLLRLAQTANMDVHLDDRMCSLTPNTSDRQDQAATSR